MTEIKISIVVPVYQAEKYLKECLESLINQNIKEYEIICIDDGSTDQSAEVIHEFQQKTDKIVYYYQNNKGVSAARNQGIALARGKYLMFVDSDDKIKKNILKYLYKKAENKACDILVFGGKLDPALTAPEWMRMAFYTRNKDYPQFVPKILYKQPGAQPSVCNKLFEKECIRNVRFPETISIAEDMTFLFVLFPTVRKLSFIRKRVYLYRLSNEESAMHQTKDMRAKYMENHVRAAEIIAQCWKQYKLLGKDNAEFAEWLTSFLRGPYKELEENEVADYLTRIERIYASINSKNLLLKAESQGGDIYSINRIRNIICRDIKKYGIVGGIENILFKMFYRR